MSKPLQRRRKVNIGPLVLDVEPFASKRRTARSRIDNSYLPHISKQKNVERVLTTAEQKAKEQIYSVYSLFVDVMKMTKVILDQSLKNLLQVIHYEKYVLSQNSRIIYSLDQKSFITALVWDARDVCRILTIIIDDFHKELTVLN